MPARRIVSFCALGAAALVGCGAPSFPAPPPPSVADPCLVADSNMEAPDTLRVALRTRVRPDAAPIPVTDDERLVFRQLYETLVRVDCAGTVRPGLATAWHRGPDASRWTFELAPGARFWDGTPLDAAALSAAWRDTPGLAVADVRTVGNGAVEVSLTAPRPIAAFGDPAWSVVKRIAESPWPLGTGPVWVRDWEAEAGRPVLRATPVPSAPAGIPVLEFRTVESADPRDVLDRAVEVVVTRDARAVRYASSRDDWRAHPLPWDRVYVLASPVRLRTGTTTQLDSAAREALARDAVRDDARASTAAPWWARAECPPGLVGVGKPGQEPLVRDPFAITPAGDRVAMDLVARLVARTDAELGDLIGARLGTLRAEPAEGVGFDGRLATGDAPVFVFPVSADPLDGCRAAAYLRARAPWLDAVGTWSADVIAPLVETRAHLLLRAVRAVTLDRDGGVRLLPGRSP